MIKALLFALLLFSASGKQHKVNIEINDVDEGKGTLYLAFWDNSAHFLNNEKIKVVKVQKCDSKKVKINIDDFKPGWWAMAVLQDENGNKDMDYNFLGIPTERFGFSNNPTIVFSEPSFDECKFYVGKDTTISVKLK